jgi:hypothetical protein
LACPFPFYRADLWLGARRPTADLERANSTLSLVLAMHIRRDKLEFGVPLKGDGFFVCHAGLVVENLEINQKTLAARHVIMAL